jgi:hypothetical protein
MRCTEWLPVARPKLVRYRSLASVAPRAAIGDRGRSTTNMRSLSLFLTLVIHISAAWSQDVSHFRRAEIPRNESRLSELARVREFRCDYDLARFTQGTLLIAEVFRDGKCIDRFRLSRAKYDESEKNTTGVISIGWQRDTHHLVSVHDNGVFYSPWTASFNLPDFSPVDAYYFSDSLPERRKPDKEGSGYFDFELYPVIGLCGQRTRKIRYPDNADTQSFLKACNIAGAQDAIIIYMYFSPMDEEPALKFNK